MNDDLVRHGAGRKDLHHRVGRRLHHLSGFAELTPVIRLISSRSNAEELPNNCQGKSWTDAFGGQGLFGRSQRSVQSHD